MLFIVFKGQCWHCVCTLIEILLKQHRADTPPHPPPTCTLPVISTDTLHLRGKTNSYISALVINSFWVFLSHACLFSIVTPLIWFYTSFERIQWNKMQNPFSKNFLLSFITANCKMILMFPILLQTKYFLDFSCGFGSLSWWTIQDLWLRPKYPTLGRTLCSRRPW